MYEFFAWLIVWYFVMAFAEYLIHKHTMHKKQNWLPSWVFTHHAIDHHRDDRHDLNIDLPVWLHLIVGSPLIVGSFLYAGWVSTVPLLFIFFYEAPAERASRSQLSPAASGELQFCCCQRFSFSFFSRAHPEFSKPSHIINPICQRRF